MARPTLYGPPVKRVNGWLGEGGASIFALAHVVAGLAHQKPSISDGNVMEFVLRDWKAMRDAQVKKPPRRGRK